MIGPAVKRRDEDARGIDHVAVAAHHAPGGVRLLHERLIVALAQVVGIALAQLRPPAVGLAGVGNGCLDRDLRVLQAQIARGIEKIQVAAVGHAADEVADTGGVDGVHGVKELLLQLAAARVILIAAPGQLVFPVAGEAAGVFALGHGGSLLFSGGIHCTRQKSACQTFPEKSTCNLRALCYNADSS